jgi:hypothetical protein
MMRQSPTAAVVRPVVVVVVVAVRGSVSLWVAGSIPSMRILVWLMR